MNRSSFAFVRCVVDDVGTIDVKISDYLKEFYTMVYVLGFSVASITLSARLDQLEFT